MIRFAIILTTLLSSCGMATNQANTLTIDELLTQQRDQYLTTYKLGLTQNRTNKSAIEVMLQITADQNRSLPEPYQLNRYDLVNINAEGKFNLTEFNLNKDSLLKYEKQVYDIEGMEVEISPFVWNGCEFNLDQKPNIFLENWARKWLDIGDKKTVTADGFLNVIHSLTYPREINGEWTTSIDFGSSTIDAFKELLSAFSKQGIKKV